MKRRSGLTLGTPAPSRRPAGVLTAFVLPAMAYLLAGGVAGALALADAGGQHAGWLSLHLVFAGGISQVLIGAAQFFSTAYLATEPPAPIHVRAQLVVWNGGVLLLAIGVPLGAGAVSAAGGALLAVGLALYAVSLRALQRRSLRRPRWTLRWYHASAAMLAGGSLLGGAMASDAIWTHGSLLGAHLTLNLAGWLGGAIVGTLQTFYPTLCGTQLPHPRLEGPTFIAWFAGVLLLAAGELWTLELVAWAGWAALSLAALLLGVNVVDSRRAATQTLGTTAQLVGAAQGFLLIGLMTALVMSGVSGPLSAPAEGWRAALGILLGAGWIGLTFLGSLLHLTGVLSRVRAMGTRPVQQPQAARQDRPLVAGLSLALVLLAAAQGQWLAAIAVPAGVVAVLLAAPFALRILRLVAQAIAAPRAASRQP